MKYSKDGLHSDLQRVWQGGWPDGREVHADARHTVSRHYHLWRGTLKKKRRRKKSHWERKKNGGEEGGGGRKRGRRKEGRRKGGRRKGGRRKGGQATSAALTTPLFFFLFFFFFILLDLRRLFKPSARPTARALSAMWCSVSTTWKATWWLVECACRSTRLANQLSFLPEQLVPGRDRGPRGQPHRQWQVHP